jgi:spermidine/putrescine-binding protein
MILASAPWPPDPLVRPTHAFLALAALAVAGAGCSSKGDRTLHLYIWSNYVPPDVLSAFEKEHRCRVAVDHYGSNDELLGKLQLGNTGFDVAVPSESFLAPMVAQGLLERIDPAKVPNRRNLDPRFVGRESDPKDEWSVPYAWGTVGIAWRADKLGEGVDS